MFLSVGVWLTVPSDEATKVVDERRNVSAAQRSRELQNADLAS